MLAAESPSQILRWGQVTLGSGCRTGHWRAEEQHLRAGVVVGFIIDLW